MTKKEILARNIAEAKKIEALETFLQDWKAKSIAFIMDLRSEFVNGEANYWGMQDRLTEKEIEIMAWDKEHNQERYHIGMRYYCKQHFASQSKWHEFVTGCYSEAYTIEDDLENIFNKELDKKRASLMDKVLKHVGTVTDASGLSVGKDGEINGNIIGTDGACRVTTIGAGGYNIQCYHFRLLVKKLKEIPATVKQESAEVTEPTAEPVAEAKESTEPTAEPTKPATVRKPRTLKAWDVIKDEDGKSEACFDKNDEDIMLNVYHAYADKRFYGELFAHGKEIVSVAGDTAKEVKEALYEAYSDYLSTSNPEPVAGTDAEPDAVADAVAGIDAIEGIRVHHVANLMVEKVGMTVDEYSQIKDIFSGLRSKQQIADVINVYKERRITSEPDEVVHLKLIAVLVILTRSGFMDNLPDNLPNE